MTSADVIKSWGQPSKRTEKVDFFSSPSFHRIENEKSMVDGPCSGKGLLLIYEGNTIPFIENFEDNIYLFFNPDGLLCAVKRLSL